VDYKTIVEMYVLNIEIAILIKIMALAMYFIMHFQSFMLDICSRFILLGTDLTHQPGYIIIMMICYVIHPLLVFVHSL